jgi:hypothetical protein
MIVQGPLAVLLILVLVVLVFAWRGRRRAGSLPEPPVDGSVRRAWLRRGCAAGGVVAAVAVGYAFGQRAIFVYAPLAVFGYLVGVLVAELTMPGPTRATVRRASLRRRSVEIYVPAPLVWGWRASAAAAVGALAVAGAVAGADGRSFTMACGGGYGSGGSPWPGWEYGAPALVTLLFGAVLVEAILHRVPARPRPDSKALPVLVDEGYRVSSARRALSAGFTLALVPLAGVTLAADNVLRDACPEVRPGWLTPLAIALVVIGLAAGLGALVAAARFLTTPDWFPPAPEPGGEAWT